MLEQARGQHGPSKDHKVLNPIHCVGSNSVAWRKCAEITEYILQSPKVRDPGDMQDKVDTDDFPGQTVAEPGKVLRAGQKVKSFEMDQFVGEIVWMYNNPGKVCLHLEEGNQKGYWGTYCQWHCQSYCQWNQYEKYH